LFTTFKRAIGVVPSLDLIGVNRVDEKMTKRAVHKREMAQVVRMA
jgi:hypothetical protein